MSRFFPIFETSFLLKTYINDGGVGVKVMKIVHKRGMFQKVIYRQQAKSKAQGQHEARLSICVSIRMQYLIVHMSNLYQEKRLSQGSAISPRDITMSESR